HPLRENRHLLRSGGHPRINPALGKISLKTDPRSAEAHEPQTTKVLVQGEENTDTVSLNLTQSRCPRVRSRAKFELFRLV
ncbi:hypothetical protein, partial [Streptomyces sp. NPDC005533]|uniref:hypothetical protein n=1 Tax=Streptomyces sp. NPDC005533 TaxID=3364723 RepID=UPI0036C7593E